MARWPNMAKMAKMAIYGHLAIRYRSISWSTIQHTLYNTLCWLHLDKSEKCLSREVDPGWMIQQLNLTIVKHPFFLHIHTYYILYLAHSSRVDHLPTRSFNFFQTHFHTLLQVVHLIRSDLRERSKYNCMWERSPGYQAEDFPELAPHTAAQDRRGETSWKPMLTWHCI